MVSAEQTPEYDETALSERLGHLTGTELVAFAAACAERLMPVYDWAAGAGSRKSSFGRVREALDVAWSANPRMDVIEQLKAEVEALVPDEDDEGFVDVALAQNAVACVAYVLRFCQSGRVQDAVWAARQLWEAADYVIQRGTPLHTYYERVSDEPVIQLVLRALTASIDDVRTSTLEELKARAQADGEAFLAMVKEP